jgi:tetratricopeptide (TPR) repeat protein
MKKLPTQAQEVGPAGQALRQLGGAGDSPRSPEQSAVTGSPVARQLWQMGQVAIHEGRPDEAIACYQQSLAADPSAARNHLSLAAAYLEKGDEVTACSHLGLFLQAHPEHLTVRTQYGELLSRLHRPAEARAQFERFIADAQDQSEAVGRYLLHCHTRLMELAEDEDNEYDEHLNRGIGLLLLARQRLALPDPDGELSAEGLLCKAAGELTLARLERPDEARPCWYLYQVWSQLGQCQPAQRCLRQAETAAPFSYLTPAEQGHLQVACRGVEVASHK